MLQFLHDDKNICGQSQFNSTAIVASLTIELRVEDGGIKLLLALFEYQHDHIVAQVSLAVNLRTNTVSGMTFIVAVTE